MIEKKYTVSFPEGLHARPAKALVELARQVDSAITVKSEHGSSNGKNILSVMALQASKGAKLDITIDGPDEKEVKEKMDEFFLAEL